MKVLFNGKVYADYYTFYLQDQSSTEDYEALATDYNFEKMLGVGNQMLSISTKRYNDVPVSIKLYQKAPKLNPTAAQHINNCTLLITTKALLGTVISGMVEIELEPGHYQIRILYKNLSSVQDDWTGKDKYEIQIWKDEF
jgi:hypothetical protein